MFIEQSRVQAGSRTRSFWLASSSSLMSAALMLSTSSAMAAKISKVSSQRPSSAQTASVSSIGLGTSTKQNPERPSRTQLQGALRFESTQYPTPVDGNPKLSQSQLLQADLRMDWQGSSVRNRMDISAGRYLDLNNSYWSVQELYTSSQFNQDRATFSFGRRIEFWSQLDSDWQLGLWEPKANFDSLRPVNQGLSGFFLKSQFGAFEALGYFSPFFVPTMTPEISEKNGSLVSDSRWYKTPASSAPLLGKQTQFVYDLSIPELAKLVGKPGAGLRLRWNGRSPGPWASANLSRKPINSLFIKYDYNLVVNSSGSQAQIDVSPAVSYHRLMGVDAGWIFNSGGGASVSYLEDQPEKVLPTNELDSAGDPRTDWIQQNPGRLKIFGLHAETTVDPFKDWEPVLISMDYMRAFEDPTRDLDAEGEDRGALLPSRLNFTHAVTLRGQVSGTWLKRPLVSSVKYLRDFDQNGSLWSASAQYFVRPQWIVTAGIDILGVDDDSMENSDRRFLNQFRTNDRYYGGLSYVF